MALLKLEQRKEYFKTLGLGEYNEENIKAVQKKYMLRKSDADGVYGTNTDNLLRHLMNCHLYLDPDNFRPEEFRCGCNGRHCCGYPMPTCRRRRRTAMKTAPSDRKRHTCALLPTFCTPDWRTARTRAQSAYCPTIPQVRKTRRSSRCRRAQSANGASDTPPATPQSFRETDGKTCDSGK